MSGWGFTSLNDYPSTKKPFLLCYFLNNKFCILIQVYEPFKYIEFFINFKCLKHTLLVSIMFRMYALKDA